MFHLLTESQPRAARLPAHRYVFSAGVHGVLISAAALLSGRPSSADSARPIERAMPLLLPVPVQPSIPAGSIPQTPSLPGSNGWNHAITVPDLSAPVLSSSLPTSDDLLRGVGSFAGDSGLTRLALAGPSPEGSPATAGTVDEPVTVIAQPEPRYPAALAAAGVSGRVVLDYVVDTAGRAEPASLRVVAVSHPAFEQAARASILASRFQPARLRGEAVRQLVRQVLSFRLDR